MKIYKAHLNRDGIEIDYKVKAESEEAARKRIFEISGERNVKVTEI